MALLPKAKGPTLYQVLKRLGYTTKRTNHNLVGYKIGTEIYNKKGICIGIATADQVWKWLRKTKQI